MKEFPIEVVEFYRSLENIRSINIWDIHNEIKFTEAIDEEVREKVITERKVLSLNLHNGQLISNIQITDQAGLINEPHEFSSEEIAYLESRSQETFNLFLKSRYFNILWQQTKNNTYATKAIDSYIDLLDSVKPDNLNDILPFLKSILYISKNTKQEASKVKSFILSYLNKTQNWIKGQILDLILDSNYYKKNELLPISDDVINWIDSDNYFLNKNILETALILFKKIGRDNNIIYKQLAFNEDIIINKHPDESDFIRSMAFGQKAHYLKKSNNLTEYDRTMAEYNKLKRKTRFNKISTGLDEKHTKLFNKYLKFKSEAILKLPSESILAFFACDESILVDPTEIRENATKNINNSLKDLFSVSSFDINSNFKKLTDRDKLEQNILNNYTISHNIKFYALFIRVFMEGIIRGKLDYYKVLDFLKKYTWYGQKFNIEATETLENDTTSWLSMLAPGIHNFFSQFEFSTLLHTNKINNYILSIDSLTLKFEGALRDFIRLTGGNTTVEKKEILQEQLLDELIENPKSKEFFSERDIALFKYAFTRNGLNIRNNVAHCFFRYSDYTLQNISIIFLCLLRLGQFELTFNRN